MSETARKEIVLGDDTVLHVRPATTFVKAAMEFQSDIFVTRDGQKVNGKSVMELLTLAAGSGHVLLLEAEGPDAQNAVDTLSALVEGGFSAQ